MIAFWTAAALLIGLLAAAVLIPLWRYRPQAEISQDRIDTRIFRDRLAELDQDRADGRIDPARHEELRAELERTLLDDVSGTAVRSGQGGGRLLASFVTLLILAAAVSYYYLDVYRGPTQDWQQTRERLERTVQQALLAPDNLPDAAVQDLPDFTRVLQARVLREGKRDPDALFLLGISLIQLQAPTAALDALQRAHRLAPRRTDIMLAYAQAEMLSNDGQLTATSARLLQAVLGADPQNRGALMLLGFGAFNAGDYPQAIAAWQSLRDGLTPDSEPARLLDNSIARARQLQSEAETRSATAETDRNTAAEARIDVTVDLAPELRDHLDARDTLFIFAKAADGPPMPLAAVRQSASGFPVQVVLDDSKSMLPSMKLSNFQDIVVGARISKAGDVTAKPGDLEAPSTLLDLSRGPQSVSLTVDRVVQ